MRFDENVLNATSSPEAEFTVDLKKAYFVLPTNESAKSESAPKCLLVMDKGDGDAQLERFYYDSSAKKCNKFAYGGAAGNENNFATELDCLSDCYPGKRQLSALAKLPILGTNFFTLKNFLQMLARKNRRKQKKMSF